MRLFASAAVLAAVLASSAFAQAPAEPPAAQPDAAAGKTTEKKDAKADGVICRREIPTGSLFAVKVCTTAEQRKAQSNATHKAQDTMQSAAPQLPQ